ncbi:hypothetical protein [Streptomyces clavuligerus]|uniref:hypothetical protein n=1 Tax=Streptomyces clavuligerus TaxID=1901 RepID=UPI001E505684|nr:hypothetical protein [Streptomyces clavuligerus]WDN56355.1 hypothetical protein LL058_31380 [Streptomyces clavuligerus]
MPVLRRSGVVSIDTAEGDYGQDVGLKCKVLPLWAAQDVLGHRLNLSKKEYATLWRRLEAVMGPGWAHRDGSVTPAGLIGMRTGRGAATDRLPLLLVLEARESGRLRLCGGAVDTRRGRAAATVARLLGCSAAAGERVLERLEDQGLVLRVRLRTGSGLSNRSRLVVPAVAAAHGRTVAADDALQDGAEALEPGFSDPDVTAGPGEAPGTDTDPQVSGVPVADATVVADSDVAAALHTDHPPVVSRSGSDELSGGFSVEGRGVDGRRPDRACVREDQAVDRETGAAGTGSSVAEGGPLRGEQPKESPVDEWAAQRAAGAGAGGRPKAAVWETAQQQRRVGLPADLRLRVALGPVSWLWERLSGWQQDQVEAAAKAELMRLTDVGVASEGAPRLLADRLTDRLRETGGEALVTTPYGWLIRRGLPQRQTCSHRKCDDGVRLDTGEECENCGNVIHLRRALRARTCAEVDRELPGLTDGERQCVLEERLREHAAVEAEDFVWRRERAREQQARRDAARAAAAEWAEAERAAVAAADTVRQALLCEGCGQPRAGGLCETYGYRRRTETLIAEAGLVAAAWAADLTDAAAVAAVRAAVRACLEAAIRMAQDDFLRAADPDGLAENPDATESALAFTALHTLEQSLPEYHSSALDQLGRTPEADAEARRAYKTEQGRRWYRHNPHGADAVTVATKAAHTARERAAEYLLAARLKQLREQAAARTEQATAAPWTERSPPAWWTATPPGR